MSTINVSQEATREMSRKESGDDPKRSKYKLYN